MRTLEQLNDAVLRLEKALHIGGARLSREDIRGSEVVKTETVARLVYIIQSFNNTEGLPYLDKTHLRKLVQKAVEVLGDSPELAKLNQQLVETEAKLSKSLSQGEERLREAENTIRLREEDIKLLREHSGRLVKQLHVAEVKAEEANREVSNLRDYAQTLHNDNIRLGEWVQGKKGIEDYYRVTNENRKLQEDIRKLKEGYTNLGLYSPV